MRTKTAIVVCSALALVLAFLMSPAGRARFGAADHRADLVRAARATSFRPSQLRLSIDAYRPVDTAVRGSRGASQENNWKFLEIAAESRADEKTISSIEPLHTHGLALLLAGKAVDAVNVLKRATTRAVALSATPSETAALWNDLAVASFECAKDGDARQYVNALDAAEKAWAIDRTPAIAWTRATLLEQLNLRNQAASAWAEYMKQEPDASWSAELRERLSKEAGEHASRSFTAAVHDKLIAACARGDIEAARAIVSAHSKEVRAIAEDELLGAWAEAAIRHSIDEPARFQTLRTLGLAFRQTSGDLLLMDVVTFIDTMATNQDRRNAAAAPIQLFAQGREAYKKGNGALAEQRLARAEEALRRVECPLALLANVYRAAMVYASNQYADVAGTLDTKVAPNAMSHYHALRGVRGWVMGLAYAQTGRPGASVDAYELALDGFRAAGEQENVAAVLHLRAETLDYMTATDEAWDDRMKGVEMFRGRSVSARPLVWMTVAMAAVRDHLEHAADVILAEVSADAQSRNDAMWMTEAAMWRALARSRMGRPFTQSDIEAIRQSLRGIPDPAIRSRSEANLHLVSAEIAFRTVPVADIDQALNFYRTNDDRFNGMSALAFAAHKRAASADFEAADASLVTALAELERQARDVSDPFMRALFAERARALMLTAEDVQLMRGKPVAALWFSDRARRIGLPDWEQSAPVTGPAQDAEALGRALVASVPRGVTFLHQDVREETLRSWIIRDGQVHFIATPISSAALYGEIDEFTNDRSTLQHSQRLYELLMRPLRTYLTGDELLVYSPAAVLRGIPVAALHDGHRFMIETRPIAVARDIASVALRAASTRSATGPVLVMLPEPGPGAPSLPGAKTEVLAFVRIYGARAVSLFGARATPESFLAAADEFGVIHISGHGRIDRRPLQNAIEFGTKRLRAYDVLGLHLTRHPVVVLAGCRTDDETEGRATLSLARAFVSAGASAVVGSLWNVDDEDTARIMTEFHQDLSNGLPPEQALCLTQRSAIARRVPLSSWAAFQTQM
jgi:hypothetical protein